MLIYKITNMVNEKFYIGKTTKTIEERLRKHCVRASAPLLHSAIKKYGIENFKIEQVDSASSIEELNKKEQFWIAKTDAIRLGYNLANGGDGGAVTGEPLERIRKHAKNRKFSASTRKRMSDSHKGSRNGRSKKVLVTLEDGSNKEFISIKAASDFLGFSPSTGMAMAKGVKASKRNISIRILE